MRDPFSLVGTSIDGRYRIDAVIGEGGFGVVYRGLHQRFEHPIAVKCLKIPSHFTNEAKTVFLQRFKEEGKILLKLSDAPGVPRVYDYGIQTLNGVEIPFLVLEWLDGQTLEHVLEARRAGKLQGMPPGEALGLILPAVDAIALAHESQIAHRDIKPANLFLSNGPRGAVVKVLDFGIAKAMQEGESLAQAQTKTATSFRAFTPNYAAPEQFTPKRFGASGPWTDVHALGLVLVEMLTDRPANPGDDLVECLESVTSHQRPSPQGRGASISDELEAVVIKAVALQASERYPSAAAFAAALRGTPEAKDIPTRASLSTLRGYEEAPPKTVRGTPISGTGGTQIIDDRPSGSTHQGSHQITEQPVTSTKPGVGGPAIKEPPPRPSSRQKRSPLPMLLGALAVVGLGAGAFVIASKKDPSSNPSTDDPTTSAAGATSSARPPSGEKKTIHARSLFTSKEILPVLVADAASFKGQAHYRFTEEGGRVTLVEQYGPMGDVKQSEIVSYPEGGGWEKTIKNARGVLVETIRLSAAGVETHVKRSGMPFTNGCARFAMTFTPDGNFSERVCQDDNGHTIIDESGCQVVRFEFGPNHFARSIGCHQEDGKPILDANGVHLVKLTYDDRGNLTEGGFFDVNKSAVANTSGCMRMRFSYDQASNKTLEQCIGATGLPTAFSGTKISAIKHAYDERGCEVKLDYVDVDNRPASINGVFSMVSTRDRWCSELSRAANDASGNLVAISGSAAKTDMLYDDTGNLIEMRCFDTKSAPFNCDGQTDQGKKGCVRRYQYDDRGRELSSKAFDDVGSPSVSARNYPHEARNTYDDRGLTTETKYLDPSGNPAPALGTVARRAFKYDALGSTVSFANFGVDGSPSLDATGLHELRRSYDDRHRLSKVELRDPAGEYPTKTTLIYDGMAWPNNAVRLEIVRGDKLENRFYDKAGKELSKVDCTNLETRCMR